jgi:hypothetical protein
VAGLCELGTEASPSLNGGVFVGLSGTQERLCSMELVVERA